jgi:hypothetical protein
LGFRRPSIVERLGEFIFGFPLGGSKKEGIIESTEIPHTLCMLMFALVNYKVKGRNPLHPQLFNPSLLQQFFIPIMILSALQYPQILGFGLMKNTARFEIISLV